MAQCNNIGRIISSKVPACTRQHSHVQRFFNNSLTNYGISLSSRVLMLLSSCVHNNQVWCLYVEATKKKSIVCLQPSSLSVTAVGSCPVVSLRKQKELISYLWIFVSGIGLFFCLEYGQS